MDINLKSEDLNRAVDQYVRSMVTVAEGMDVTTTFKAGRNGNGFTAAVSIAPATVAASEPVSEPVEEPKVEDEVETPTEVTEEPTDASEAASEATETEEQPAAVAGQSDSIFGNN